MAHDSITNKKLDTSSSENIAGRIKALVLRRDSDWYCACFGMLRQPIQPAAAAAAIESRNKIINFIIFLSRLFLLRRIFSLRIYELYCGAPLLRHPQQKTSAAIGALLYGHKITEVFLDISDRHIWNIFTQIKIRQNNFQIIRLSGFLN